MIGARDRRNAQTVLEGVATAATLTKLELDVSTTYVEAEVQAIADKVDAIIAALSGT